MPERLQQLCAMVPLSIPFGARLKYFQRFERGTTRTPTALTWSISSRSGARRPEFNHAWAASTSWWRMRGFVRIAPSKCMPPADWN